MALRAAEKKAEIAAAVKAAEGAIVSGESSGAGCHRMSALCRSRRLLSNAYLLSKFGFDTAENEQ